MIDRNIIHQKDNASQRYTYIRPAVMAGMIIASEGRKQLEFEIPQSVTDNDVERFGIHFLLYSYGDISEPSVSVVEPIPVNSLEAGTGDADTYAKVRLSRLDEIENLKD